MSAGYFAAPVVRQLFDETNATFPNRDRRSDGILGDPSHAARKSEHNPCWTCTGRNRGIILAGDIDVDDGDPTRDLRRLLLNELIGDPRVWYVISNQVIYSRTHGWQPRVYAGPNGHFGHVHVSFLLERAWDTAPFFGPDKPGKVLPPRLSVRLANGEYVRVVRGAKPRFSIDVRRTQRLLVARGIPVTVDGLVGEETLNAWGRLEARVGGTGRPRVPDDISIRNANRGMFRIVA